MKLPVTKDGVKQTLTIEKVINVLKEGGVETSEKKAEDILELLYFLANLIVKQNFKNENSRPLRSGKYYEQADKGFSQRDQEERLKKYCENNNISIRNVIYEDHSAKSFIRTQWEN